MKTKQPRRQPRRAPQRRQARARRGAVMIVVLSLLVLFTLIGITFVVIASRYKDAAEAAGQVELKGTDPEKLLDQAAYQLVRGTTNQRSAAYPNDLLSDVYGKPLRGVISITPHSGAGNSVRGTFENQFLSLDFNAHANEFGFSPIAGSLNGCILTVITGPLRGTSTRIVGYLPNDAVNPPIDGTTRVTYGTLQVETFLEDAHSTYTPADLRGHDFIVNGIPFSGTGLGYSSVAGNVDVTTGIRGPTGTPIQVPFHFAPNLAEADFASNANAMHPLLGGANESYDAVDAENMFLSMFRLQTGGNQIEQIIPSFHRPALVKFWRENYFQSAFGQPFPADLGDPYDTSDNLKTTARRVLRRITYRPLPFDHPNFTGGNLALSRPANGNGPYPNDSIILDRLMSNAAGIWDVDNDGDGISDSVWLDLGLPVTTDKSGRRYKPLFAVLIRDLDGRLNLNAHESLAHVLGIDVDSSTAGAEYQWDTAVFGPHAVNNASATTTVYSQQTLARGRGAGPAEIALQHIFVSNEEEQLLRGKYDGSNNLLVPGRYGADTLPGEASQDDELSALNQGGTPQQYFENLAMQSLGYASTPDVIGFDTTTLDFTGNPISLSSFVSARNMQQYPRQREDDPYEKNFGGSSGRSNSTHDQLFAAAELERLLRWYDIDTPQLPSRLIELAPRTFNNARNRSLLTTEARHLPVPNVGAFAEIREKLKVIADQAIMGGSITADDRNYWSLFYRPGADNQYLQHTAASPLDDVFTPSVNALFAARLLEGGVAFEDLNDQLAVIVPMELLKGELFNVNRPWGNGNDDSPQNGIVDEPSESQLTGPAEKAFPENAQPNSFNNVDFEHLNNMGGGITNRRYARQIYARHLYCTMMMLVEEGFEFPFAPIETLNATQKKELTAARIAQWAINVVDFRDPDAIMSPFEYDVDPFNQYGWQTSIDGNPATNDLPTPVQGQPTPPNDRRLVWGAEYPDLLLTEGFASHDRAVKDTKDDNDEMAKREKENSTPPEEDDDDLDQYRIPQGSLFLELYCPRNFTRHNPRLPQELYNVQYNNTTDNFEAALDLGRVAPVSSDGLRYPVWRIGLSEAHQNSQSISPLNKAQALPDSTSFEPENMSYPNLINPSLGMPDQLELERYIWLAPLDPGTPNPSAPNERANNTYYCRNFGSLNGNNNNQPQTSNVLLAPGGYAVVGPRLLTRFGTDDDMDTTTHWDPSAHRLELNNQTFTAIDNDATNRYPLSSGANQEIQAPLGIIAAAKPPTSWSTHTAIWDDAVTGGIGVSVSEPLPNSTSSPYYPEPGGPNAGNAFIYDTDPLANRPDGYDEPDPGMRTNLIPDTPFDENGNRPLGKDPELLKTGTKNNYASAFLQRLANPLEAHDPVSNPYITVDWSTIDLTVFNGEDKEPSGYPAAIRPFDPSDPDPDGAEEVTFSTRERGNRRLQRNTNPYRTTTTPTLDPNPGTHNYDLWEPLTSAPVRGNKVGANTLIFRHNLIHSLGYLNRTLGELLTLQANAKPDDAQYIGSPAKPFPWLVWHNRPFATPHELMLVPSSSQARMLHERKLADPGETDAYYRNDANASAYPKYYAPFGDHGFLLNFYGRSRVSTEKDAQFVRLFDFVETPSPYVGSQLWYKPSTAAGGDRFRPPYNKLSRFRDPGKVNLNTIFEKEVWEGLMRLHPNMTTTWEEFVASRRGYGAPTDPMLNMNSAFPTAFANPVRAASSADIRPNITNMRADGTGIETSIEATMFRPKATGDQDRLIRRDTVQPYNDSVRNPYFRYQAIDRMPNLVTNHSNVYAIWLTVGYFEVDEWRGSNPNGPQVFDAAHPDGFQLGQEVGALTGEIERHRAFYLIDRSIPVGFEPGENHNVDRAILIRRFIE